MNPHAAHPGRKYRLCCHLCHHSRCSDIGSCSITIVVIPATAYGRGNNVIVRPATIKASVPMDGVAITLGVCIGIQARCRSLARSVAHLCLLRSIRNILNLGTQLIICCLVGNSIGMDVNGRSRYSQELVPSASALCCWATSNAVIRSHRCYRLYWCHYAA